MSKGQSQVSPEVLSFFKDPDASSILTLSGQQVNAPTVRGQDLTDDEMGMGGGVRIVIFALDASPSMKDVAELLLNGFNEEYVPAVKEARQDDIAALRIGGIAFSSEITQIWNPGGVAFHKLEELPRLTKKEYNPKIGNGTALHQAIIDAYHLAAEYAAKVQRETGILPEIDINVLTDGKNNDNPLSPVPVRTLIKGSKPELVRFNYFFFETEVEPGQSDVKAAKERAKNLGFETENTEGFAMKPGESKDEYRQRFRRMLRVMSQVSASKGTSVVQAAAAQAAETLI